MQISEPRCKILLIDDDPDFVATTKTVLAFRPDYKV